MASERELERLVRLFERAEEEVARDLADALTSDDRFEAEHWAAKRREIRGVLEELRQLSESGRAEDDAGPAWRMVRDAYREGAERSMPQGGIGLSFTQADQRAAEVVYANLAGRIDDAVVRLGRQVDDVFRSATLEETLQGIIAGRSRGRISGSIEDVLRRRGVLAFTDAAGRNWKLGDYTRMAARTARIEASSWGALNRIAENGVDLVDVVNPTACPVCRPFVRTYSMSGDAASYPVLAEIPPFHPNCTCILIANRAGLTA